MCIRDSKAGAEAGAATFMSAFNDFNNEPATGSSFLLRELLKNQWGFFYTPIRKFQPIRVSGNGLSLKPWAQSETLGD